MSRLCNHWLAKGVSCNRTIENRNFKKCNFHQMDINTNQKTKHSLLEAYIRDNKHDKLYLNNINFTEAYPITGVEFPDCPVIFDNSTFKGTSFESRELTDASFQNVTFDNCQFNNVTFKGKQANFRGSIFKNTLERDIFYKCTFDNLDKLDFSKIEWHCRRRPLVNNSVIVTEFDFSSALLICEYLSIGIWINNNPTPHAFKLILSQPSIINLSGIIFIGHFELGFWPTTDYSIIPQIKLESIDFDNMKSVRFINAKLNFANFNDSLIQNINFIKPSWPLQNKRKILYNDSNYQKEVLSIGNLFAIENHIGELNELRRLYGQLKKNYENRGLFSSASDWHYREMEARLHTPTQNSDSIKLKRRKRPILYLYKLFSNYGESYSRPLKILLAVILIGAFINLFSGYTDNNEYLNYDINVQKISFLNAWEFTKDYFSSSILYSLSNISFLKTENYTTFNRGTIIVNILLRLSIATFLPLFLLALRRRFRR